jgi:Protein of unknown function (DUF3467)
VNQPVYLQREIRGSRPATDSACMSEWPNEGDPEGRYANFFKVGFNAYEFVIDFGQQYEPAGERMHTRIVTSPAMARNLRDVLEESVREFSRQYRSQEKER